MKVTASSPGPQPEAADPARARAVQFFRKCGYSPEDAATLARVAAEARLLQPADSGDGAR